MPRFVIALGAIPMSLQTPYCRGSACNPEIRLNTVVLPAVRTYDADQSRARASVVGNSRAVELWTTRIERIFIGSSSLVLPEFGGDNIRRGSQGNSLRPMMPL
jgi:hypothetical protein